MRLGRIFVTTSMCLNGQETDAVSANRSCGLPALFSKRSIQDWYFEAVAKYRELKTDVGNLCRLRSGC